jgi:hypothetical protein
MQPHHIRNMTPSRPPRKPDPVMHNDFNRFVPGHPLRKAAAARFIKAAFDANPEADASTVLHKLEGSADDLRKSTHTNR